MNTIQQTRTFLTQQEEVTEELLATLELELICKFLDLYNLTPIKGSLLEKIVNTSQKEPLNIFSDITSISTDDLVYTFEVLVPTDEAKKYGAFFTPHQITTFMAKSLLSELEKQGHDLSKVSILDPAVGCGALLIATAQQLSEKTGKSFSEVAEQLSGTDIGAYSIHRAKLLFELIALKEGSTSIPNISLKVQDGLIVDKTFDGIIANPPYVRYQVMDSEMRARLSKGWETCSKGNYNLYFPFIENAYKALGENGVAIFITPNGFIDSSSGEGLREWVMKTQFLNSILDFGGEKVFEVMTYTAITKFVKKQNDSIPYNRVKGLEGLANVSEEWEQEADKYSNYKYEDITASEWNFIDIATKKTVDKVEAYPIAMNKVFDIRYGLATLRDKIFTFKPIREEGDLFVIKYDDKEFFIEKAVTQKCLKISSIAAEKDIPSDTLRIIYPYTVAGEKATIISEADMKRLYPHAYEYLTYVKPELLLRDHGKKEYAAWYAYGRTQGLIPIRTKLFTPLYAIQPRFMKDEEPTLFLNGCALVYKEDAPISLDNAQKFLNSDEVKNFMLATSRFIDGGFVAYQKAFLSKIRFPKS